MSDHAEELIRLLREAATQRTLQKATFSAPRATGAENLRVDVRPTEIRGEWMLQFTTSTATQQFHRNMNSAEASSELARLASEDYRNVNLTTADALWEARTSRKDKCFLRRTGVATRPSAEVVTHNRKRNYLIPEGVPCPFLIHTGVMTKDGSVRASHARKFGQINRFLEFVNDIVEQMPSDRPVQIVDFGCGKSYLTFATHYLLTSILQRECRIIGLDRRKDVVATCTNIVRELQLQHLEFSVGDIAGFESSGPVDLVISLHACDTATDYALAQGIRWQSRVILAVPCCQHELNEHLQSGSLAPLTSYGLTKERFASLATDTMRAGLLSAAGYQTQVLEFIDMEHTPKNILIRGVLRIGRTPDATLARSMNEVQQLRNLLKIPPLTLEQILQRENRLPRQSEILQASIAESSEAIVGSAVESGGLPDRSVSLS
ncbi:MAG: SAM-dependent methyltransferase [Planctomycetaceae bacterium]